MMKNWPSRILFGFLILTAIAAVVIAYSYFIEPSRLVVNQQTIKIKKWNSVFDGLKIVVISDIHGGSNNTTAEKLREIVTTANLQNADLIVLLGDFVSQNSSNPELGERNVRMPVNVIAQNLAGLKAKYGVIAVMGNHDDWYGSGEVIAAFRSVGYAVLDNEIVTINKGGQKLRVLGLRDHLQFGNWKSFSENLKRVLERDNGYGDLIVLEHSPDVLPVITGDLSISPDLRLILAGHTHGGQVWLPIFGTPVVPSSYGQKYSYGRVRENNVDMFVTSGVGTSILPFRFMMPPEIAVLTVRTEN